MLNDTAIMGRLTADPELRRTQSGTAVCGFTLAVERDGRPGEDGKRTADFIDCVAWRGTAEFLCRHFGRGQMVVATGRLQTRTWKDRDGRSRKATELNVANLYFGATGKLEQAAEMYSRDACGEITEDDGGMPF